MSDILIKGMGIPKDCKYVDVRIFRDGTATTSSAEEPFYKKMDVFEVPPHGRLIEEEPIIKYITDGLNSGKFGYDAIEVLTEIKYAPTIIPAEEGE